VSGQVFNPPSAIIVIEYSEANKYAYCIGKFL
jgi:hypothetical protein